MHYLKDNTRGFGVKFLVVILTLQTFTVTTVIFILSAPKWEVLSATINVIQNIEYHNNIDNKTDPAESTT